MNNGGPAFPSEYLVQSADGANHTMFDEGMTLRDYFAAKAMNICPYEIHRHSRCAEWAYVRADAMLKAREKK